MKKSLTGSINCNGEQLLQILKNDLELTDQIGLHCISDFPHDYSPASKFLNFIIPSLLNDTHKIAAHSIMRYGLNNPYVSCLFTVTPFGSLRNVLKNEQYDFLHYQYWSSFDFTNIIVAVPPYLKIKNQEYFIGYLPTSYGHFYGLDSLLTNCLFDDVIPREFIYGKFTYDFNDHFVLKKNQHYIRVLDDNDKNNFFNSWLDKEKMELLDMVNKEQYDNLEEKKKVLVKNTIAQKHYFKENGN